MPWTCRSRRGRSRRPSCSRGISDRLRRSSSRCATRLPRSRKAGPAIPSLPVMAELPKEKRRVSRILRKGNFLDPGPAVGPGVPASLHGVPAGAPLDRLGLARWLVDRQNPLTARVAVNRLWSQIFGAGIVETEEDFGTQGEPPSHPELLDWLAIYYQDSGWDTKDLLRLIVTSATYRQSSKATPELLERDPRNRLLARAPRMRLEAEMVRDQAMALSGLLFSQARRPECLSAAAGWALAGGIQRRAHLGDQPGADRYRRGLYTFWRRTVPYPSMATFDAPSREICAIRRVRTNTPLQSFVTLNDPVYVEAAQALARRIVREGGDGRSCPGEVMGCGSAFAGRLSRNRLSRSLLFMRRNTGGTVRIPRRPRPCPGRHPERILPERAWPSWPPGRRSPTSS